MVLLLRFALVGRHFERHDQLLLGLGVLVGLFLLLLLLDELILDESLDLVWVVLRDVGDAFAAGSDEALEREVVASRERVVLVGFDVAARVFSRPLVELVLVQHYLQLFEVYRYRVLSNDDAWIVLHALALLEPDVRPDVGCGESLGGIRV